MKTIAHLKSPTCMEDRYISKLMSCCPSNTSAPHKLKLSSFRCFVELLFGGGWCILGETALENSLQSNKLVDRKQEVKYTSKLLTPSIG